MEELNITSKLADCSEVLLGKNIDKKKTNEKGNGTPYITGASDIVKGKIVCKRFVDEKDFKNLSIAKKGDIIISTVGTLGKVGVLTMERAVLSGHCAAIRPKKGVSLPFLVSVVSRLVLDICPDDDFLTGFSRKLDIDQLKSLQFTLPQLIVQEHIVSMMTTILTLTITLETENKTMEDHLALIDYLAERYKELRARNKERIKIIEKLEDGLSGIEDVNLAEILSNLTAVKNRLINI